MKKTERQNSVYGLVFFTSCLGLNFQFTTVLSPKALSDKVLKS